MPIGLAPIVFSDVMLNINVVQDTLVAKLESELNLEGDVGEAENYSQNIKDYLENSPFEVTDVTGEEEVVLTRKYNNETYVQSRNNLCTFPD